MNHKLFPLLFYLAAICFYVVAIINIVRSDSSSGVIWLCLGSAFLCIGTVTQNKNKPDKTDDNDKPDQK